MNTKTASVKVDQGLTKNGANGAQTAEKPKVEIGVQVSKESGQIIPMPRRKMTVEEKLDSLHKLEAIAGKIDYLRECKENVDKFGTGRNGFQNSKIRLEDESRNDVTVSNPAIVEELLVIAKMRLVENLKKAEKEIEEFEIM